MGAALLMCRLALASVFATAGVAKLADLAGSRRAMAEFGVPERFAPAAGTVLPVAELAVAAALIPDLSARPAALVAVLLLAGFSVAIATAARGGRTPECHSFGQLRSAPAGRRALVRNALLLGLAGFDAIASRDVGAGWAVTLPAGATVLAALVMSRAQPPTPEGLPQQALAPDFELIGTNGARHSLRSLRARAPRLMLVFTDAACGPCEALMPALAEQQQRWRTGDARLAVAVLASGNQARNRARAAEHGLELMLLQAQREVAEAYGIPGTPMAVVIDDSGRIEGPPLAGPDAIASLLAPAPAELGAPIPNLVLPDLDRRPVSLRELYRDPTVVLFWDPHCEFSRQMLPGLRAFEREAPPGAPGLIVISAGDVSDQAFRSPVVLDPEGRARAAFGVRGTPTAVLLSEDQVASPVAAGARMVFDLIDAATLAPR